MAYPRGKSRPPTNKDIPHTEATKKKISESCKRVNMGKWNAGRPHSKEWIDKIAEKLTGLKRSPEFCKMQSVRLTAFYQTAEGLEIRRQQSIAMKAIWKQVKDARKS